MAVAFIIGHWGADFGWYTLSLAAWTGDARPLPEELQKDPGCLRNIPHLLWHLLPEQCLRENRHDIRFCSFLFPPRRPRQP